jgi:hypothetical protein
VAICPHSAGLKKNNSTSRGVLIAKETELTRSAAAHHSRRRAVPEQLAFDARKFRIGRKNRFFQIIQTVETEGSLFSLRPLFCQVIR